MVRGGRHELSTTGRDLLGSNVGKVYPFEVKVESGEGGSAQPGKILLDQIRTVDKARLGKRVGQLPGDQIEEINRAIRLSLAV